jgi:hypothetical protein
MTEKLRSGFASASDSAYREQFNCSAVELLFVNSLRKGRLRSLRRSGSASPNWGNPAGQEEVYGIEKGPTRERFGRAKRG